METISIPEGVQVKLRATISSDAVVATHVRVGGLITTSTQYKFTRDLGSIVELKDNIMTIGSHFYVPRNINQIMNTTQVIFKVSYNDEDHELTVEKKKSSNEGFTAYAYVKFIKS